MKWEGKLQFPTTKVSTHPLHELVYWCYNCSSWTQGHIKVKSLSDISLGRNLTMTLTFSY